MRSRFAHSLLLVRYSVFIALGGDVRRFSQLILSVSHQGKAAAYVGVAVLRLAHRPVLRLVFSSRLYVHRSLFIRVVASKKRRRFPSPPLASCLTPSNPPPVASFASLIRLVPRLVPRLAGRLVPARAVPRPAIPSRPHRIPVPSGDTRGGAVFSHRPVSFDGFVFPTPAPFSQAHSFRRLVVPAHHIDGRM